MDWRDRPLLLIVDGDEEIGEDHQAEVLARLNDFLKRAPQRLVLTLDERTKHIWNTDIQSTAVLVTRPKLSGSRMFKPGAPRFTWLKALKNSARN